MDGKHGFSSSVYVGLKRSRHTYPKEALPVALQSEIPWRNWAAKAQGIFAALLERQLESFCSARSIHELTATVFELPSYHTVFVLSRFLFFPCKAADRTDIWEMCIWGLSKKTVRFW